MDEKPDQIMSHIESQRDQLGRNLNELETRVKRSTDWRVQFDRNPMLMMGVALGGGLLLGTITSSSIRKTGRPSWSSSSERGSSSLSSSSSYSSMGPGSGSKSSYSSALMGEQRRKATDTLEQIKSALIGFATAKVKEFMTQALPGFNQHLEEAEHRSSTQAGSQNYPGQGTSTPGNTGQQQSTGAYPRTEYSTKTPYQQEPVTS